jgi:hypothetical protein
MVRLILWDTTMPFRMRPRMDTSPVKGHCSSRISSSRLVGVVEVAEVAEVSLPCGQHRAQA